MYLGRGQRLGRRRSARSSRAGAPTGPAAQHRPGDGEDQPADQQHRQHQPHMSSSVTPVVTLTPTSVTPKFRTAPEAAGSAVGPVTR